MVNLLLTYPMNVINISHERHSVDVNVIMGLVKDVNLALWQSGDDALSTCFGACGFPNMIEIKIEVKK